MTQKLFADLGLSDALLQAIGRLGYEKAAPVQAEAIPLILAGHDVVGQSQTGSGKTAAFSIPESRQFICFSATMSKPILDLIRTYAPNAKSVRIEHKVLTVPTVEQAYYESRGHSKTEILTRLIDLYDLKLGIIFCNTKRLVDSLTEELVARGYSADRIHGDMNQSQRDRVMNKFRSSGLEFLVATDVAARGIDVDNIEVVFNCDLPWDEEDYIHRIGRTGRIGRSGRAFSFVTGREIYKLQSIERFTRTRIPRHQVPSLEQVEEKRINVFFERIRKSLKQGEFREETRIIDPADGARLHFDGYRMRSGSRVT